MQVLVLFVALWGYAAASGYGKSCYQCAYSPPKTYYDRKVVVENYHYGQRHQGYGDSGHSNDNNNNGGYGGNNDQRGHYGGYSRKTYVPVRRTVYGGWDKCMGELDHYSAKANGVDVWECHSNCYVRKDPNGDVFRGCYKGEFGVNPYQLGCNFQAGALYCFCEGDKCNTQDPDKWYRG